MAAAEQPENSDSGCMVSLRSDCIDGEGETHTGQPKPKKNGRFWSAQAAVLQCLDANLFKLSQCQRIVEC